MRYIEYIEQLMDDAMSCRESVAVGCLAQWLTRYRPIGPEQVDLPDVETYTSRAIADLFADTCEMNIDTVATVLFQAGFSLINAGSPVWVMRYVGDGKETEV